jgi:thiopeptide-type bacteriocin biosynthesis protein
LTWLSIHVFPKEENIDEAIARWFGLFIARLQKDAPDFSNYFFVRSLENGAHFRLRLGGEPLFFEKIVTPLVIEIFEKQAGAEIAVLPFEPEITRFGGSESYFYAQMYFVASSQLAFRRISESENKYEFKLADALRMHIGLAIAADFTKKEASAFFSHLAKKWMPIFFQTEIQLENGENRPFFEEINLLFAKSLSLQESKSRAAIDAFWADFEEKKGQKPTDEWSNWLKINETLLPEIPPESWPDLLHLTNNRLGITNQDEVFLCYLLGEILST